MTGRQVKGLRWAQVKGAGGQELARGVDEQLLEQVTGGNGHHHHDDDCCERCHCRRSCCRCHR